MKKRIALVHPSFIPPYIYESASKNAIELLQLITNKELIESIPESIVSTYKNATAIKNVTFWNDVAINLPNILVHDLFDVTIPRSVWQQQSWLP